MSAAPATALPRVATRAEAEGLLARVGETMDALLGVMEAETRLVRAGKLREAGELQPGKAELARRYLLDVETVKTNRAAISMFCKPMFERLRQRHESFSAQTRINLGVLATAKAVTESLVQEIAAMETRASAPRGYAANGAATGPKTGQSNPIGVARSL